MEIFLEFTYTWYGSIILILITSVILFKACDVFESCTLYLGRNMNEGVRGATLNAIGSSFPELLTTIFFLAFATHENLGRDFAASVGGNTGSAIFNSIIIPMLVIWVVLTISSRGIKFSKKVILRDGLFLIAAEIILLILLSSDYITFWHGAVFTGFYLIYLSFTLFVKKKKDSQKKEYIEVVPLKWFEKYQFKSKNKRTVRSWILLTISAIVMAVTCAGIVEGCKGFADSIGINPLFVALVVVASASSIPDTIISVKDARKGNFDDSIANVLASNIFDITISMGLPLMIYLLWTGQKINFIEAGPTLIDIRLMLVLVTVITIAIYYFSKELKTKHIIILGFLYTLFIFYAIWAADYFTDGNSYFASLENYLRKPGGIADILRDIANKITKNW